MNCSFFDIDYQKIEKPIEHFTAAGLVIPPELSRAVDKRKIDFLAGRYCATKAIAKHLGQDDWLEEIPIGESRAPLWPLKLIGSITHTKKYGAAIIANDSDYVGIGIDAEALIKNASHDLAKHICCEGELETWLKRPFSQTELLTLIFSAKETLFKCIYPSQLDFFGFHDARLRHIGEHFVSLELCRKVGVFPKGYSLEIQYHLRDNMFLTRGLIQSFPK